MLELSLRPAPWLAPLLLLTACASPETAGRGEAVRMTDPGNLPMEPTATPVPPAPPALPPVGPEDTFVDDDMGCTKMDILFVIDNSGSMQQEQENLAANFPRFIELLDQYEGGILDYRVGVTTTAVREEGSILGIIPIAAGDNGALMETGNCGTGRAWMQKGDTDLVGCFSEVAQVGTDGSSQEMPLLAARLAVTDRTAPGEPNEGFLRDDALLALVFITDEDDVSTANLPAGGFGGGGDAAPVADFLAAIDTAAGGEGQWAAAVVAGDLQPGENDGCRSEFGRADHAVRLQSFVEDLQPNGMFSSICADDLTPALEQALDTFTSACDTFVII